MGRRSREACGEVARTARPAAQSERREARTERQRSVEENGTYGAQRSGLAARYASGLAAKESTGEEPCLRDTGAAEHTWDREVAAVAGSAPVDAVPSGSEARRRRMQSWRHGRSDRVLDHAH